MNWIARIRLMLGVMLIGLLVSCSGGGGGGGATGTGASNLKLLPTTATSFYGNPITLSITGGRKPYKAFSSNQAALALASSNVSGSSFVMQPGSVDVDTTVTVEVQDALGAVATATVTVKPGTINNSFKVTPASAVPGVGCEPAICSGQTALVQVTLKTSTGAPIVGRTVRFDNASSSGEAGAGGDYVFVNQVGTATPNPNQTTAITDTNGVAQTRIRAITNAPTQYALITVTDAVTGSFLHGSMTIAQYTNGAGTLTVLPETATWTDTYKDGYCSSGARTDYQIFGGTPPYRIGASFPQAVALSTTTVATNGGFFTSITNGTCVDPLTFTITDATGRTVTSQLKNIDGSTTPPTGTPEVVPPLVLSPSNGAGSVGQSLTFVVAGGRSGYGVSSNNPAIASVSPVTNSGGQYRFTATLNANGSTVVTVTDAAAQTATAVITVASPSGGLLVSPSSGAGTPGNTLHFAIAGGATPYTVLSNNPSIATATIAGNQLDATLVAAGTTTLVVRDNTSNTTMVSVTVAAPSSTLALSPTSGAGNVGNALSFVVTGGTPSYSVSSNNNAIATVTPVADVGGQNVFTASLVGSGSTVVTVTDSAARSATAVVTASALGSIAVSPASGAGNTGNTLQFAIAGGTAPYTVISNNTARVTASISGNQLNANLVSPGTTSLIVSDSASRTILVPITVDAPGNLAVAPSTGIGSVGNLLNFTVGGGTPPYTAISNNSAIATAGIAGNQLTSNLQAAGSTTLTVSDSAGRSETVSVTVTAEALTLTPTVGGSVAVGQAFNMMVSGGRPPYAISSTNTSIGTVAPALVATSGGFFALSPMSAGSVTVIARDAAGTTRTVPITVTGIGGTELKALPTTVDWTTDCVLPHPYTDFVVYGGTGPYTAFSTSPLIATITGPFINGSGINYFRAQVECSATGNATLVIRDSAGATSSVTLTVTTSATTGGGTADPVIAPSGIAVSECTENIPFIIRGGTAPFTLFSTNTVNVTATNPVAIGDFHVFTVTTNATADVGATITALDAAFRTTTASVGVSDTHTTCNSYPEVALSPSPITLQAGASQVVTITGGFDINTNGSVAFTNSTSDNSIVSVGAITGPDAFNSYRFTINANAVGTAIIYVVSEDAQYKYAPVTVIP